MRKCPLQPIASSYRILLIFALVFWSLENFQEGSYVVEDCITIADPSLRLIIPRFRRCPIEISFVFCIQRIFQLFEDFRSCLNIPHDLLDFLTCVLKSVDEVDDSMGKFQPL